MVGVMSLPITDTQIIFQDKENEQFILPLYFTNLKTKKLNED